MNKQMSQCVICKKERTRFAILHGVSVAAGGVGLVHLVCEGCEGETGPLCPLCRAPKCVQGWITATSGVTRGQESAGVEGLMELAEAKKEEEKKVRLLFQLHHASTCTNQGNGICMVPVQNCDPFKALVRHVLECENKICTFPRCNDARGLLIHYRRCENPRCKVCGPLRRTILSLNLPQIGVVTATTS